MPNGMQKCLVYMAYRIFINKYSSKLLRALRNKLDLLGRFWLYLVTSQNTSIPIILSD